MTNNAVKLRYGQFSAFDKLLFVFLIYVFASRPRHLDPIYFRRVTF